MKSDHARIVLHSQPASDEGSLFRFAVNGYFAWALQVASEVVASVAWHGIVTPCPP